MAKYGKISEANLEQVHPELVRLAREVIKHFDHSVIDGIRTLAEQEKNLAKGVSKTMHSKHLPQADGLSHALDVMPYPVEWGAVDKGLNAVKHVDKTLQVLRAYYFQGVVKGLALSLGIDIRQGVDWDGDTDLSDQTFHDIPHVELRG